VATNIDLSKIRFNSVNYLRRDLEERIRIPSRDQLIVDTYLQNVPGKRAVVFAVNVDHSDALAEHFRIAGIAARSVSGRVPVKEREAILERFRAGELLVLCACDVLNEGWDCAKLEVLLMARPTLSRILYMQQLGRGTRKAPGKEELIVFDFVDNASRYNVSQSLHRILGKQHYLPGVLVKHNELRIQRSSADRAKNPPRRTFRKRSPYAPWGYRRNDIGRTLDLCDLI
jgi:superfamily II DNA or RNA helicase